jgi:hypothetical protein
MEEQLDAKESELASAKAARDKAQKTLDKIKNEGDDSDEYSGDCHRPCITSFCESVRKEYKISSSSSSGSGGDACMQIYRATGGSVSKMGGRCWDMVKDCGTVKKERDKKEAKTALENAETKLESLTVETTALNRKIERMNEDCVDCRRAAGGLYGGTGIMEGANGATDRVPSAGESIVAGLSAITPMVLGGLSTYQYSKGVKGYYGAYNNQLKQCVTIGVPCASPGYGLNTNNLFGNLGSVGVGSYGGGGGVGVTGLGLNTGGGGGMGGLIAGGYAVTGGMGAGASTSGYGSLTGGYGVATMPYGYGMSTPMLPSYSGVGGMSTGMVSGGYGGLSYGVASGGYGSVTGNSYGAMGGYGYGGASYGNMYSGGYGVTGGYPYLAGATNTGYGYGGLTSSVGGYNPQYQMLQQASLNSSSLDYQRAQQSQQDLMIGAQQMQEAQSRYYQTIMQTQSFGGYGSGGYTYTGSGLTGSGGRTF